MLGVGDLVSVARMCWPALLLLFSWGPQGSTRLVQPSELAKQALVIEVHASEIHASRTCQRKWHGIYVHGKIELDTANGAMARGTAIHAILEDYLNGNGPIDTTTPYGRIAAAGLKFLPQPRTVHSELDFSFPAESWIYAGTIDMIRPYYVGDHKTTSNFKYQKTQEVLIDDPQAILYGTRAQLDGKSDIECQWIYYRTSGAPKAQETRFVYPGSLLQENKQKLDEEVRTVLGRRSLKLLDLEPTPSACFKYGKPCHLRSHCTDLRPSIGALMSQSRDDLLASLKAKALGAAAANPAGVAIPPPATVATPPAGLPALPSLATPAPAAAAPPAPVSPPAGLPALPGLPGLAAPAAQPAAAVAPPTGLPSLPGLPGVAPVTPPAPAQQTLPAIDPAVMAAAAAEAQAKAAKAAQAAAKPAAMPPLPPPPGPPAAVAPPAQHTPPAPDLSGQFAIGTLYIDCLPLGKAVKPFSDVAKLCHDGIRETTGLMHYRMGEYGKGLGIWVEAVKLFIGADPQSSLYVDTASGDGRDALEALTLLAANVVRGIK